MAKLTFRGGVHPYEGKELSKDKPMKTIVPKGEMVYPLSQHIGAPAVPVVKKGDKVLVKKLRRREDLSRHRSTRRCLVQSKP